MDGLSEGRIVHYVIPEGERNAGEHRPAIVVRVWRVEGKPQENGLCQLQVFFDGTNDGIPDTAPIKWRTSVTYDAGASGGTWHWIERA